MGWSAKQPRCCALMANDSQETAANGGSVSSPISSPAALIELAHLLARQAAQAHFTACEEKGDIHHEQTD